MRNNKKKTQEEYIIEVAIINPNIEVVGQYVNAKTAIMHRCKIHNIDWMARPDNILHGRGCPECANENRYNIMRRTHEDYVSKVQEINQNIIVLGIYVNARTPILHKCKIDECEWMAIPDNILRGEGCPKCARNNKKNFQEYVYELSLINSNIEVVDDYINAITPILHRCLVHNIEWKIRPNDALRGKGCPICGVEKSGNSRLKTHVQYVEELKLINKNIVAIENYNGANTPILHKCLIDEFEWYATPHNILCGTSCPRCNVSKGEKAIRKWLTEHNIEYDSQKRFNDCCDKNSLPFDFYLPNYNCCIEYDGIQHFEPIDYFGGQESLEYTQKHDKIKTEYCQNNNIKLLRIPYFKNIEEELNNFFFFLYSNTYGYMTISVKLKSKQKTLRHYANSLMHTKVSMMKRLKQKCNN